MRLKRVLHVPDTHAPFHDKLAFKLMLKIAKDFKPDKVVFLGDFFDFYSVSRHDKDPMLDFKTWKDEMKEARSVLDEVVEATPTAKTYIFLEGNHEKRIHSYIANHAPKLSGIFRSEELLGLPHHWTFLKYGQQGHFKIGNLTCCHGSRAGENPAAAMVKKYRSSVLFGHTHKIQEFHIQDIHGKDFVGLNAGWLGDQKKGSTDYIKDVSDWSLGFAVTWHKDDGTFFHQLIHIKPGIPYEAYFNEALYRT